MHLKSNHYGNRPPPKKKTECLQQQGILDSNLLLVNITVSFLTTLQFCQLQSSAPTSEEITCLLLLHKLYILRPWEVSWDYINKVLILSPNCKLSNTALGKTNE